MKEELLKLIIKKQYTKLKNFITEMNIQDVAEILSDWAICPKLLPSIVFNFSSKIFSNLLTNV